MKLSPFFSHVLSGPNILILSHTRIECNWKCWIIRSRLRLGYGTRSGVRFPTEARDFFFPNVLTGCGAHPAYGWVGPGGDRDVKLDHSHPSCAANKNEWRCLLSNERLSVGWLKHSARMEVDICELHCCMNSVPQEIRTSVSFFLFLPSGVLVGGLRERKLVEQPDAPPVNPSRRVTRLRILRFWAAWKVTDGASWKDGLTDDTVDVCRRVLSLQTWLQLVYSPIWNTSFWGGCNCPPPQKKRKYWNVIFFDWRYALLPL